MEKGFGGPVWHVSVSKAPLTKTREAKRLCRRLIAGHGNPAAGEWWEHTDRAVHLRRRLSGPDLALLPAEYRELVDVRTWDLGRLSALVDRTAAAMTIPGGYRLVFDAANAEIGGVRRG